MRMKDKVYRAGVWVWAIIVIATLLMWLYGCSVPQQGVVVAGSSVSQVAPVENELGTCERLWEGWKTVRCIDEERHMVCYVIPTGISCVKMVGW